MYVYTFFMNINYSLQFNSNFVSWNQSWNVPCFIQFWKSEIASELRDILFEYGKMEYMKTLNFIEINYALLGLLGLSSNDECKGELLAVF